MWFTIFTDAVPVYLDLTDHFNHILVLGLWDSMIRCLYWCGLSIFAYQSMAVEYLISMVVYSSPRVSCKLFPLKHYHTWSCQIKKRKENNETFIEPDSWVYPLHTSHHQEGNPETEASPGRTGSQNVESCSRGWLFSPTWSQEKQT